MKGSFDEHDFSDLKREVAALHKKIEDLEAVLPRPKIGRSTANFRAFLRRPALAAMAIVAVLLALGVLGAESKHEALFIDQNGNVGIGRTDPKATLDVAGTLKVAGRPNAAVGINTDPIPDQNLLIAPTQGNIPLNVTDPTKTTNWLSVLSDGKVIMNGGNVGIGITNPNYPLHLAPGKALRIEGASNASDKANYFSFGGNGGFGIDAPGVPNGRFVVDSSGRVGIGNPTPAAAVKLDVAGDVRIQGKVSSRGRYQRDDEPETTYELPPPYHFSLTAAKYAGRTKTIPQDVLVSLCGGPSGCEVRLGMTRWDSDSKTAAASRSVLFYYSANDGRWRANNDNEGIDGDGRTQHVMNIWDTCYFTDGTYANYKDLGDKEKGMQVLLWNGNGNGNRTCELTLTSAGAP